MTTWKEDILLALWLSLWRGLEEGLVLTVGFLALRWMVIESWKLVGMEDLLFVSLMIMWRGWEEGLAISCVMVVLRVLWDKLWAFKTAVQTFPKKSTWIIHFGNQDSSGRETFQNGREEGMTVAPPSHMTSFRRPPGGLATIEEEGEAGTRSTQNGHAAWTADCVSKIRPCRVALL